MPQHRARRPQRRQTQFRRRLLVHQQLHVGKHLSGGRIIAVVQKRRINRIGINRIDASLKKRHQADRFVKVGLTRHGERGIERAIVVRHMVGMLNYKWQEVVELQCADIGAAKMTCWKR